MSVPIYSGGDLRVRWHEFAGLTDWMDCEEVSIEGGFVVINTSDYRVVVVPAHRIYRQLEVAPAPTPTTGESA